MAEQTKPNLYQKLLLITEAVGKIEKTGNNTAQNYKFIEQAAVVAEVRVQLAKHGVMIIPETIDRTIERYTTTKAGYQGKPAYEQASYHINVKSRYTLVNADNPTETMVCEWDAGEALDTSDKATNKATTASHKSFLMKLFNISDKDDPDAHSPEVPPKGIDEHKSPDEPSRDIKDEPISELSKAVVKEAIQKSGKFKTPKDVIGFYDFVINKAAPTTEADATEILKALEAE